MSESAVVSVQEAEAFSLALAGQSTVIVGAALTSLIAIVCEAELLSGGVPVSVTLIATKHDPGPAASPWAGMFAETQPLMVTPVQEVALPTLQISDCPASTSEAIIWHVVPVFSGTLVGQLIMIDGW